MKTTLFVLLLSLSALAEDTYVNYTLKRGETLAEFSYRVYGTHQKWNNIYQDNLSVISNLKNIPEGTVLRVKNPKPRAENAQVATVLPEKAAVLPQKTAESSAPKEVKRVNASAFTEMELPK